MHIRPSSHRWASHTSRRHPAAWGRCHPAAHPRDKRWDGSGGAPKGRGWEGARGQEAARRAPAQAGRWRAPAPQRQGSSPVGQADRDKHKLCFPQQQRRSCLGQVCAIDERDGHASAVGRGRPQPLGGVGSGVKASQHRLHLLHRPAPARGWTAGAGEEEGAQAQAELLGRRARGRPAPAAACSQPERWPPLRSASSPRARGHVVVDRLVGRAQGRVVHAQHRRPKVALRAAAAAGGMAWEGGRRQSSWGGSAAARVQRRRGAALKACGPRTGLSTGTVSNRTVSSRRT